MSTDPFVWLERLKAAMRTIAGDDFTTEVDNRWRLSAQRREVAVTFLGPSGAGKSALIKRLLVEDGTPVPSWLAIGEGKTRQVGRVTSGPLMYVDTPGLATGEHTRDQRAYATLTWTDVLVLVVPPDPMAGEEATVLDIVSGRYFNPAGPVAWTARSLVLVIGRADSRAPSPFLVPEEFTEFRQVKIDEYAGLLDGHVDPAISARIHFVSADPDGIVDATPAPRPQNYPAAPWDGVAGLLERLHTLPAHGRAPRLGAMVRHWCWYGRQAAARADASLTQARRQVKRIDLRISRIRALEAELDGIRNAADADLRARLHETIGSAVRSASLGDDLTMNEEAAARIRTAVVGWQADFDARLGELVRRAGAELAAPSDPQPNVGADDLTLTAPQHGAAPAEQALTDAIMGQGLLQMLNHSMQNLVRLGFEHHLGITPEEARDTLRSLASHGTAVHHPDVGHPVDIDLQHVQHDLDNEELIEAGVPAALMAAGAVLLWLRLDRRQKAEQAERARHAELPGKIEISVDTAHRKIFHGEAGAAGWVGRVDEVRRALRARAPAAEEVAAATRRLGELTTAVRRLDDLLQRHP